MRFEIKGAETSVGFDRIAGGCNDGDDAVLIALTFDFQRFGEWCIGTGEGKRL